MALVKTEAIVLKSQKQGETTKILTLYSKAFGKMKAIAKGARSIKSRFWGSLEPLNHVAVVFYRKETRELQFLSQADIIHPFLRIRSELGRTSLGLMACEWVNRGEIDETSNPQMFSLLLDTIQGLNGADKGLKNVLRSFQLHFLELHGFKPELAHCASCRNTEAEASADLDFDSGSYLCGDCSSGEGRRISSSSLKLLRWLGRVRPAAAGDVTVPADIGREVDDVLYHFAKYHVESLGQLKAPGVISEIEEDLKERRFSGKA